MIKELPGINEFNSGVKEIKKEITDENLMNRREEYSYNVFVGDNGEPKYKAEYKLIPEGECRKKNSSIKLE